MVCIRKFTKRIYQDLAERFTRKIYLGVSRSVYQGVTRRVLIVYIV